MRKLEIAALSGKYEIIFGEAPISELTKKSAVIVDEKVNSLYGDRIKDECLRIVLPSGESSKNMTTVCNIYEKLIGAGFTRDCTIVAFGGGVTGDITGFVAATFLRGVSYIQIPTTLISQTDSSIGGKTGVDFGGLKNTVGAFYPPKAVYTDIRLLKTLPDDIFSDGMAEVVKYALIEGGKLYEMLKTVSLINGRPSDSDLEKIIYECCEIKKKYVEADELDRGGRIALNFGHTVGHAIEAASGFRVSHGRAVALGMCEIVRLTSPQLSEDIENLVSRFGLPTNTDIAYKPYLSADKKKTSQGLRIVKLEKIGQTAVLQADGLFGE